MSLFQSDRSDPMEVSPETRRAEEKVAKSTDEFETAMNHLEEVVESAGQRVMNVISRVQGRVDEANKKITQTIRTAEDTLHKPKEFYDEMTEKFQNFVRRSKATLNEKLSQTNQIGQSAFALSRTNLKASIERMQSGINYAKDHSGAISAFLSGVLVAGAVGYTIAKRRRESAPIESGAIKYESSETSHGVAPEKGSGVIELNKNLRIA